MKLLLTLILLFSLPSVALDHHSQKSTYDKNIIEIEIDENMEMSGKNVVVIKLDENMQMPDGSTIEFKPDENMEMSGEAKERMMNHPNYLMNRKECKKVKDGVSGFLSMSDGIWKEIKENPEDKEKWSEVIALSGLASNYSNIYDVWCKGLARNSTKTKIKAKKFQKNNKDKKD
ncbi:hypothetical protein N9Y24_01715 [Gammaproteobacteria bacterium]|jgi:hypothetical protein|nr:hypothetical protein [Gammaproteobacteria bacterium]MDB9763842.1 hypothetical protein [Gammaproteobacteria bacterium]